jgi:hypothetical protein
MFKRSSIVRPRKKENSRLVPMRKTRKIKLKDFLQGEGLMKFFCLPTYIHTTKLLTNVVAYTHGNVVHTWAYCRWNVYAFGAVKRACEFEEMVDGFLHGRNYLANRKPGAV